MDNPALVLYRPFTTWDTPMDICVFEFDSILKNRHWASGFKSLEDMLEDGWVVVGRFDEEAI